MPVEPNSSSLTIRFKSKKTTTLLHVDRTLPFARIATDLLSALRTTHPDGTLDGLTIPNDPSQVHFAQLVDKDDPDSGWCSIVSDKPNAAQEFLARQPSKKPKTETTLMKPDCLGALGLQDLDMLAFRFGEQGDDVQGGEWEVTLTKLSDLEEQEPAQDDDAMDEEILPELPDGITAT